MRVILKKDVENLGSKGDIVDVAPGFGRNYLIPKKLAIKVTSSNMKMIEIEQQALKKRLEKERQSFEGLIQNLSQVSLSFKKKAGEKDIFGSVSSSDIKDALHELGFEIDKKKILLEEPIKRLGNYSVPIKIFQEDKAEIKVEVIKPEGEIEGEKKEEEIIAPEEEEKAEKKEEEKVEQKEEEIAAPAKGDEIEEEKKEEEVPEEKLEEAAEEREEPVEGTKKEEKVPEEKKEEQLKEEKAESREPEEEKEETKEEGEIPSDEAEKAEAEEEKTEKEGGKETKEEVGKKGRSKK